MNAPDFSKSKMPPWDFPPEFIAEHPELHHYTNQRGLQGIWNSQQLWAKHFSHLNDRLEIRTLITPLEDSLYEKYLPKLRKKMHESLKYRRFVKKRGTAAQFLRQEIANFLEHISQTSFYEKDDIMIGPFFTSFCTHSNDHSYEKENGILSQWRGYGNDGKFAIVFDTNDLSTLLVQEWASHFWLMLEIKPAIYDNKKRIIEDNFPKLLDEAEIHFDLLLSAKIQRIPPAFESKFLEYFLSAATLLKHRGFQEEREIRIVAMPMNKRYYQIKEKKERAAAYPPFKNVFSNNGEDRRINLFESLKAPLPITRIIVGPSKEQAKDAAFARDLTKGAVPITLSETPYIGP